MSAPSKAYLHLGGESPPQAKVSHQPNTKFPYLNGNRKGRAESGSYRAIAKAKGQSPEINIVSVVEPVHLGLDSSLLNEKKKYRQVQKNPTGSETNAR